MPFPMPGNGDLIIEWDKAHHKAMIGQILALIDRGGAFYKVRRDPRYSQEGCRQPDQWDRGHQGT
jgi:hypothetical protein